MVSVGGHSFAEIRCRLIWWHIAGRLDWLVQIWYNKWGRKDLNGRNYNCWRVDLLVDWLIFSSHFEKTVLVSSAKNVAEQLATQLTRVQRVSLTVSQWCILLLIAKCSDGLGITISAISPPFPWWSWNWFQRCRLFPEIVFIISRPEWQMLL